MRFYVTDLASSGRELELPPDEAHHFARVLRGRVGDAVELFDGAGRSCAAEVLAVSKKAVSVRAEPLREDPPRTRLTTLYVAPPKGDRFRWLVEKATELGVATLTPIDTTRSVTDPGSTKLEKLRATSLAACKQCGRNWTMQITESLSLDDALKEAHGTRFWADAGSPPVGDIDESRDHVSIFIGPEGGWTDEERTLAHDARCRPFSLGAHILRTETAAIAAAARFA